ncbi:hypothetical protein [Phascolarctobacterium succinatutens]|uniref:hypothetical protein n=1 Tax=Phascolarctobacterium succinatutens TaxID=626940 RepID=UPI0026EC4DE8|nr:hypothetical protein [Phascolarctobacterium succinatutens]
MPNLPIKCSSFELNKEKIKKFSANLPRPIELNAVAEKRFHFFDHSVTGKEFNSLIQDLQKALCDSNEVNRKIIKEFASIYNTFESLDKGYIQGICASVASAEESSQQALAASEKARLAQERINITIKFLQNTVEKYEKEFAEIYLELEQQQGAIEKYQEKFTEIYLEFEQQKELSKKAVADVEEYKATIAAQKETVEKLNQKIKYAYIVSAFALVVACVNFFVK